MINILLIVLMILFWFVVRSALGMACALVAAPKEHSGVGFFFFGFFYFPFAMATAILATPIVKTKTEEQIKTENEKIAEYEEMYKAGTISWTQFCQKKEEIQRETLFK